MTAEGMAFVSGFTNVSARAFVCGHRRVILWLQVHFQHKCNFNMRESAIRVIYYKLVFLVGKGLQ